MGNNDEFSETNRSSSAASVRFSLVLIAVVGLFVLSVFAFINMVTTWSSNLKQSTSNRDGSVSLDQ